MNIHVFTNFLNSKKNVYGHFEKFEATIQRRSAGSNKKEISHFRGVQIFPAGESSPEVLRAIFSAAAQVQFLSAGRRLLWWIFKLIW